MFKWFKDYKRKKQEKEELERKELNKRIEIYEKNSQKAIDALIFYNELADEINKAYQSKIKDLLEKKYITQDEIFDKYVRFKVKNIKEMLHFSPGIQNMIINFFKPIIEKGFKFIIPDVITQDIVVENIKRNITEQELNILTLESENKTTTTKINEFGDAVLTTTIYFPDGHSETGTRLFKAGTFKIRKIKKDIIFYKLSSNQKKAIREHIKALTYWCEHYHKGD